MMRGRFITFEGGEGAGKTTQARLLAAWLRERGIDSLTTREPGGCAVAEAIRNLLVQGSPGTLADETELLLIMAGRAQHVREVIEPALAVGRWVLCDRFSDSTLSYQGFGRGLDRGWISRLGGWSAGGLIPDLTVLLDIDPAIGLDRSEKRAKDPSRFEQEAMAFHQRVRRGFLALAQADPRRFLVLDARAASHEIVQQIAHRITQAAGNGRPGLS